MQRNKIRIQLHDLLFFLLVTLSFYFTRNVVCRLIMVVFFGYTVARQLRTKHKLLYSFFYTGFFVFILYGAVNIIIGNVINTQVSRTLVVSLCLNFLMIYAIVQYIYMQNNIPKVLRITELGILVTAVVVVLLSLGTITTGRLGKGTEINANMLAMLCVYGLILSMYLRKTGLFSLWAYGFRVGFYILVILLTGSRKGLIMVFLASMVISFIFGRRKLVKNIFLGIAAAAVGYVIIMNVELLYNIIGIRIESLVQYITEGSVADGSLKSRLMLSEIAMSYIKDKPWTGYGYDCFKLVSGMNGQGTVSDDAFGYYSHNNYIELLFGGGIIGLVLYYSPMAYLLKRLIKGIANNMCVPYLLALVISKLAVEYAYVSYYSRIDAYIVAVVLGCALISGRTKRIEKVNIEVNPG